MTAPGARRRHSRRGEKRTSLRTASTLARRSPLRSTMSNDWRMFHRIAIGILFAESIAFAASDMIDRLFPALFPWVHIAIMGTSTAGVLWAFWPWIKPRLPMRRHEPEEAKKRAGEPTFLGTMGTLVGIIFIGPWVIAAVMGVLYASVFLMQFVFSGFDLAETKETMDRIMTIAAEQTGK